MTTRPEQIAGVADCDCADTTVLITGSTSGIGRAAALAVGRLGADVVVHGRDSDVGPQVASAVSDAAPAATGQFVQADFAVVDDVRALATTVQEATDGIDVLINNAGGLFRDGGTTDLGIEYTFHVNHLAPYLLTTLLLDHLTPDARVVTTASAAHTGATLDLDSVTEPRNGASAYSHSKLANILFATELARRLEAAGRSVTSNSIHPGAIPGSGFTRFLPTPISKLVGTLTVLPMVTSVEEGAAELLAVGIAPRFADVTGAYIAEQARTQPAAAAQDTAAARRLWEYSAAVLDIEEPLAAYADAS